MPPIIPSPVLRDIDGMAVIGRTLHDLRGIRYDEGEGGGAPAAEPPQPEPPATPEPPAAEPAAAPERVEDLPTWAQKIIADTRKEAADNRGAKNAETERVNAILKAAGIKTDEPDPAELLKQSQAESSAAKRELAVFKSASAAGADPVKLLDRASFLTSIASVDPTDGPAITTAIEAALAADPSLKAVRAAGASGIEQTGGTGEQGQISEAQLAQMTPEQVVEAQEKGLLKSLL